MNYSKLTIKNTSTVLSALKQMDETRHKLLIIIENDEYKNLISIGDIQRAIISGVDLKNPINTIEIDKKVVASPPDTIEKIKEDMARIRCEFMPVVDDKNKLITVHFWKDLFAETKRNDKTSLNLPVVIMAGGKGTRLKPISNIIPKALIPIGDKTIVENIMDRFEDAGCKEFHLSVNYKKEMIKHYFETNGNYNVDYFVEDKPLGTAGSLHLLQNRITTPFFVSNCDIIIDQDYHELYNYHKGNNNEITLVVALKHYSIPYGTVVSGADGLLEEMSEKPELTFKINAGLYVLEPQLLDEIPKDTFFHITDLIQQVKTRGGRVGVFPVSEKSWVDIGEWPEYIRTVRSLDENSNNFDGL